MAEDLKSRFEQAQKDVETLSSRPKNDDLLALYAHYKQATVGDVERPRVGQFLAPGGGIPPCVSLVPLSPAPRFLAYMYIYI